MQESIDPGDQNTRPLTSVDDIKKEPVEFELPWACVSAAYNLSEKPVPLELPWACVSTAYYLSEKPVPLELPWACVSTAYNLLEGLEESSVDEGDDLSEEQGLSPLEAELGQGLRQVAQATAQNHDDLSTEEQPHYTPTGSLAQPAAPELKGPPVHNARNSPTLFASTPANGQQANSRSLSLLDELMDEVRSIGLE